MVKTRLASHVPPPKYIVCRLERAQGYRREGRLRLKWWDRTEELKRWTRERDGRTDGRVAERGRKPCKRVWTWEWRDRWNAVWGDSGRWGTERKVGGRWWKGLDGLDYELTGQQRQDAMSSMPSLTFSLASRGSSLGKNSSILGFITLRTPVILQMIRQKHGPEVMKTTYGSWAWKLQQRSRVLNRRKSERRWSSSELNLLKE